MDIHIFNLSTHLIESDIKKMFSVFGTVNIAIIKRDRLNCRSTGAAYVNMANDKQAKSAIQYYDQKLVDGKRVYISEIRLSVSNYNN